MQPSLVREDYSAFELHRTMVDMDRELTFWRRTYHAEPEAFDYVCFVDLEPAIRVAIAAYLAQPDANFDDLDAALARTYRRVRGISSLSWYDVHNICRRAFQRLQQGGAAAAHR